MPSTLDPPYTSYSTKMEVAGYQVTRFVQAGTNVLIHLQRILLHFNITQIFYFIFWLYSSETLYQYQLYYLTN